MDIKIKFVKNELGNIEVLNKDDTELDGFIKHIELFKNEPMIIHLNITEEEYDEANNIYVYIRHHKRRDITALIEQLEEIFANKNLDIVIEKYNDKLIVIDLFLYK